MLPVSGSVKEAPARRRLIITPSHRFYPSPSSTPPPGMPHRVCGRSFSHSASFHGTRLSLSHCRSWAKRPLGSWVACDSSPPSGCRNEYWGPVRATLRFCQCGADRSFSRVPASGRGRGGRGLRPAESWCFARFGRGLACGARSRVSISSPKPVLGIEPRCRIVSLSS